MAVSVLQYGCNTRTPTKIMEKKPDGDCSRMLHAEQILEATPHKTAAVWPLTSHLTNYPSKMNKIYCALLENYGQTHK